MNRREIFENIYLNRKWGSKETLSGEGTRPEAAEKYVDYVKNFLMYHPEVSSILDLGHGDWKMWPTDFFKNYSYVGMDIAPQIVNQCTARYGQENISFVQADFLEADLPMADLLLIKDVLIHLSNQDIGLTLGIMKKYKYSIVVTDYESWGWRVHLGNLLREFRKCSKIVDYLFIPIRAFKKNYLQDDILTGSYHWVNLENDEWKLESMGLQIVDKIDFENNGFTAGRCITKRIYLIQSIPSLK